MNNEFLKGVHKVVRDCACVKQGERVVIITDTNQDMDIAETIMKSVNELGGEPVIFTMNPVISGGELPEVINEALKTADVIITPTSTSLYHSPGIKRAYSEPYCARVLALSECKKETFMIGGVKADFKSIKPLAETISDIFSSGNDITITTPAGTNLKASLKGRKGYTCTGVADKPGALEALPTIEAFVAPVEDSVEGIVVIDASCSGGVGLVDEPITMDIRKGKIVSISGGTAAEELNRLLKETGTESSYQVAEIGIGLNPECRVIGNTEDEGKYGTWHMGIGKNTGFGGENDAPVHLDVIQWKPTIVMDGQVIYESGEYCKREF